MRLIDLSQPVTAGCPNCPAHPEVSVDIVSDHEWEGWRVERLYVASHTGSHVDVPLHRFPEGKDLGSYPLDTFAGKAFLVDLRRIGAVQAISAAHLQTRLTGDLEDAIILLATGWGRKRAHTREWLHFSPYLAPDGAEWLVKQKVRAVGIDHYSIGGAREPENTQTHEILLRADMWVAEDLRFPEEVFDLRQPFEFWSLPINLPGFSGAFCRPVAVIR